MTKELKKDWKKKFKEEFGIHFKDSKGELEFAIAFIEEVVQAERKRCVEIARKHGHDEETIICGLGKECSEAIAQAIEKDND